MSKEEIKKEYSIKELFITQFLSSFLGNLAAMEYPGACLRCNHDPLLDPPIEDAIFIAETTWKKLQEETSRAEVDKK